MPAVHYARTVPFGQLQAELEAARAQRLVYSRSEGPLQLWCYSSKAVYDRAWTPAVLAARGLVLNLERREVAATPFPKFFNLGEMGAEAPDEPCEMFEKVDGSLIVIFHDGHTWRTTTKGSFDSSQAIWAAKRLANWDLSALQQGVTYLAEAIYPENRIVVRYTQTELVLLAAYDASGLELTGRQIETVARQLNWRVAQRKEYAGINQVLATARELPGDEEGFVLRFESGLRLKVKGSAYARTHALISRVTPLGLWEALVESQDLEPTRRLVPEEFWWDFDEIRRLLTGQLEERLAAVAKLAADVEHMTDKELGLTLGQLPREVSRYLFVYRRNPDLLANEQNRKALLRDIRPQGNVLCGYRPSYAIQRIAADE